jgi:hypothetical protein
VAVETQAPNHTQTKIQQKLNKTITARPNDQLKTTIKTAPNITVQRKHQSAAQAPPRRKA